MQESDSGVCDAQVFLCSFCHNLAGCLHGESGSLCTGVPCTGRAGAPSGTNGATAAAPAKEVSFPTVIEEQIIIFRQGYYPPIFSPCCWGWEGRHYRR